MFKRPVKSVSEPSQVGTQISPLSPGRYSRTNVSVGRNHPMNQQRNHSQSSTSPTEGVPKAENPFDDAFIDALVMGQRGRIDSIGGTQLTDTLTRRHSFPHMASVDEAEEDALVFAQKMTSSDVNITENSNVEDQKVDGIVARRQRFTRKRSMSVEDFPKWAAEDPNNADVLKRHASG